MPLSKLKYNSNFSHFTA